MISEPWASLNPVKLALLIFARWAAFVGLYMLFAFQFSVSELIAGGIGAALTIVALQVTWRAVPLRFEPKTKWLWHVQHLPAMILNDTGLLIGELWRRVLNKPSGSVLSTANFPAKGEDAEAAAKRAMAILFLTISPNSVVLDIDPKSGKMLVHQIKPDPLPPFGQMLE